MRKILKYRIVLTKNGEYKKTMYKGRTKVNAFNRFRLLKKQSDDVILPKQYINHKGIKEVKYRIYVVKNNEPNDKYRVFTDVHGNKDIEKPLFGLWTILDDYEYNLEESFWVYGYNKIHNRFDVLDILQLILEGVNDYNKNIKVVVVNNKLVIYNETYFKMVICKCLKDAQRLHHKLYELTKISKIKKVVFMGTTNKTNRGILYEIIHNNTDWPYSKIWRTSTKY
jgi:hypothetical protein